MKKSILCLIMVFTMLFVNVISVNAQQVFSEEPEKEILEYYDDNNYVELTRGPIKDKKAYLEKELEEFRELKNEISPMAIVKNLEGYKRTRYNDGYLMSLFSTEVEEGVLKFTLSGRSLVVYGPENPSEPDRLRHVDTIHFTGVGVSVGSGGGSFDLTGTTLTYDSEWQNNGWKLSHYYDGVTVKGYNVHVSQYTTGRFTIGGTTYTVECEDGSFL